MLYIKIENYDKQVPSIDTIRLFTEKHHTNDTYPSVHLSICVPFYDAVLWPACKVYCA